MRIDPPEIPTATSINSSQDFTHLHQYGTSTRQQQAFDGSQQPELLGEPSSASEAADNASVSSATSRGRRTGSRRMNARDDSSRGSPGSHIDAYEKANAIPRRPSDGVIFQVVPSSGRTSSDVSILDLPNGEFNERL